MQYNQPNKASRTKANVSRELFFIGAIMKVYLSGAITDNANYKKQFSKAEKRLTKQGYKVFSPICLPVIFCYWEFMKIDLAALDCCDAIYMLKGWQNSRGAKIELARARELNLKIMFE